MNSNLFNDSKDVFLKKYMRKVVDSIETIKGTKLSKEQIKKIYDITIEKLKASEDKKFRITQPSKKIDEKQSILNITNFMLDDNIKPIFNPYGTVFHQHGISDNYIYDIIEYLIKERKKNKNKMFEFEKNSKEYQIYDNLQKVYKVMGNSIFGVMCQSSFILFNKEIGPSITFTGAGIITSSILAFEAFLANNIKFLNVNDIITFISNTISEKYTLNINDYLSDNKIIDANTLVKYLVREKADFKIEKEDLNKIISIVKTLSKENIQKIYYKQNMESFLKDNSNIKQYINECLPDTGIEFNDIHKTTERHKLALDTLYNIFENFISYKYAYHDRMQRASKMTRKSVIVCDTDSNFIALDKIYRTFCKELNITPMNDQQDDIHVCNIITYVCSKYIQTMLDVYTSNVNISVPKQPLINMKSEFLFKRVILSQNKKQYCSIVLLQEGNKLKEPEMDIKGLQIKKTSVNIATKEYFNNIIYSDMLNSNNIDTKEILGKFFKYQNIVNDELHKNNLVYLRPAKFSNYNQYKVPESQMQVRGIIVWNALYPDKKIDPYSKVRLLLTTINSAEQLEDDEVDSSIIDTLRKCFFDNEKLKKFVLVLAIPWTETEIPEWIKPYIDIDNIVHSNIIPAVPLLNIFDFYSYKSNNKLQFSNVIK